MFSANRSVNQPEAQSVNQLLVLPADEWAIKKFCVVSFGKTPAGNIIFCA
jgi:hypothetical protein